MDIQQNTPAMDRRVLLSTIWIFAALNYLYCDIISLMDSELLPQYLDGNVNGIEFSQGFLLGAAILVEIPIAMVLLSRVLQYRVNRWANTIAGEERLQQDVQGHRGLHRMRGLCRGLSY